jgi:hypothetical protein
MAGSGSRKWPIIATIAVLGGLAVGATAVALAGSAQRRDDRAAYLRYERALLPSLRDGGRIVQQEMKPSIRELGDGELTQKTALERAGAWRAQFARILADVKALDPPGFLVGIEPRWGRAVDAYAQIADMFTRAVDASGTERSRLLEQVAAIGTRADSLFDDASRVMQFHRRRLGLGSTSKLPDPAATETAD